MQARFLTACFCTNCGCSRSRFWDLGKHELKVRNHLVRDLIWSDPVNSCESVGLFLSLSLLLPSFENRANSSRGRYRRRLITLIFAGRNRIIMIRRELPLTTDASPAEPVAN